MEVHRSEFGRLKDGTPVDAIDITSNTGTSIRFLSYGGTMSRVLVPDRNGNLDDVVLGFDEIGVYESTRTFFGVMVGRFANRIGKASFRIDGTDYRVSPNDIYGAPPGEKPKNHLHGGELGFDKKVWNAETFSSPGAGGVALSLDSPDGEEGYPGRLQVSVRCTLSDDDHLSLEYEAQTDKATPVNLTNHAFWNLSGAGSGSINHHILRLNCSRYLAVDDELIPTGEIIPVGGSPMDFTAEKAIGRDIREVPGGYDHCFVADDSSNEVTAIATLHDPVSGRILELSTSKPAVQFYGGHFLDGTIVGKEGRRYEKFGALCLETEHFPDAMNHIGFPSCILRPGETYRYTTVHQFVTD